MSLKERVQSLESDQLDVNEDLELMGQIKEVFDLLKGDSENRVLTSKLYNLLSLKYLDGQWYLLEKK